MWAQPCSPDADVAGVSPVLPQVPPVLADVAGVSPAVARPLDDRAIPCSSGAAAATRYSGHSEAVNKQTNAPARPWRAAAPRASGSLPCTSHRRRASPRRTPTRAPTAADVAHGRKLPDRTETSGSHGTSGSQGKFSQPSPGADVGTASPVPAQMSLCLQFSSQGLCTCGSARTRVCRATAYMR